MATPVNCEAQAAVDEPCDRKADVRVTMKDGVTWALCHEHNAVWWMDHEPEDGNDDINLT